MLARNFKTAAELGLSDVRHLALIGVLGLLERGELHRHDREGFVPISDVKDPLVFSMRSWTSCICGWANKLYEGAFGGNEGNNGPASKLFCHTSYDMDQATARPHLSTSWSAPGADHPAFVVRWVPGDHREAVGTTVTFGRSGRAGNPRQSRLDLWG